MHMYVYICIVRQAVERTIHVVARAAVHEAQFNPYIHTHTYILTYLLTYIYNRYNAP